MFGYIRPRRDTLLVRDYDRYRAAYGRHVKDLPRCCVFFGTCNQVDFLQDTTGNRRFWPVDVGIVPHDKTVFNDLTDDVIRQVWAEAKVRWQMGESLYLTGEVEALARDKQEEHREASVQEGLILEFIERPVPDDWVKWDIDQRRAGEGRGRKLHDGGEGQGLCGRGVVRAVLQAHQRYAQIGCTGD